MRNDSKIRAQVDALGRPPLEMLNKEILRHEKIRMLKRVGLGVLIIFTVLIAAIIIVTNLWIAVFQTDAVCMSPTLEKGAIVIAVRSDAPEVGDIVAFYTGNRLNIKRVVAVSGDLVDIDENGVLIINGIPLDEPYVQEKAYGSCNISFPYQVSGETFFVMGDNRKNSLDSRDDDFGCIPREQLIGIIKFGVWPLSDFGRIS